LVAVAPAQVALVLGQMVETLFLMPQVLGLQQAVSWHQVAVAAVILLALMAAVVAAVAVIQQVAH
jgi:hypothetical protein